MAGLKTKSMRNLLMLSCKKASELIEKRTVVPLTLFEKIRLKAHTQMCDMCSEYEKQSRTIDDGLKKIMEEDIQKIDTLTEEQKKAILDKLKQ